MEEVNVSINSNNIKVKSSLTILEAAEKLNIDIPTFCHDKRLVGHGACRICIVEVEGARNLMTACTAPVSDGMIVHTNSDTVVKTRKEILELMIENHPLDCLTCEKSGSCKLQDYCYEYGVTEGPFHGEKKNYPIDYTNEFYYNDQNKCILCGKCIRVCSELQCTGAIGQYERGFATHVGAPFEIGLKNSTCVSCGNCVSVCPVGALMPKSKEKFRQWELKKVRTTCSYCGVGCQMDLLVKNNKVVGVQPANIIPNDGLLCVKGKFAFNFIDHPDRLKTPLIRKNGSLVEATWEEAYDLITSKMKKAKEDFGSDSLAGLSSARCTNEENYLFQKLFRAVIGTNNIDHCARLCHSSTVTGLATTLGSGAMTNSIGEIVNSDVIFVIGSNTTETHPVIGSKIKQAILKGAKLIVAEPRKIDLAKDAEVFLQIKPGTNIALLNSMMFVIIKEGLQDSEYINERVDGFLGLEKLVADYSPEKAGLICGIDPEDIKRAARLYAKAEKASIFYAMGVTQHSTGTHGVMSVSNLALLCGNIGIESGGVNPLRGQNNVQGACDVGCLPGDLPGYQKIFNPDVLRKFEKAWDVKLSNKLGLTIPEIINAADNGEIKVLYIMGENPMVSDPDINHVRHALQKLDFLVVQDIFLTETAQLADVVLPAASFAEKDGTFTNTERRVQRVRKAVSSAGEIKADWIILMELMNRMGYDKTYEHPLEIMNEIASVTPQYGGINYDRIQEEGLQWPCLTKDHLGTPYLHKGIFARGKGLFMPVDYIKSAELPDENYPFLLTTGRILYHYHTRTMTGKIEGLNKIAPESYIEMNPVTAIKLELEDGKSVKVASRRGEVITKVRITDIIGEDILFMPFHFAESAANYLTNPTLDPIAKMPELKVCAVKIEKL